MVALGYRHSSRSPLHSRTLVRHSSALAACVESLESRTLLSSTLYVTAPGVPTDATHYLTLQSALAVAAPGDTIDLQAGFSSGSFVKTTLTAVAAAGDTSIRTAAALDIGEVVTIGNTSGTDPMERALVTGVTATGSGDYLVSLADPLRFGHTGSPVDATNAWTTSRTIGIHIPITLTADAGVVLPFNLELWGGSAGATLDSLSLTTAPATSLFIDSDGNTLRNLTVSNQVMINGAKNNAFSHVTIGSRLFVDTGSAFNTVADSTIGQVQLRTGSHDQNFLRDTLGRVTSDGLGDGNGHDDFDSNTFTAPVLIHGNASLATGDSFTNNTFNVSSGDALRLENASGTIVQGNTINDTYMFGRALVVHNSDNLVIAGNTLSSMSGGNTAVYLYADGTGSCSADISGNTVQTGDGYGFYFAKYDSTANLELRVQNNDLRNNAVGVFLQGDGTDAGLVDLGGAPVATRFGPSAGGNDFSSFTSADGTHYAIGLFGTSADYLLHADNNLWSVADPMIVVADATHDLAAAGTGMISASLPPPPVVPAAEVLSESADSLSAVQTATTSGVVAHFSSTFAHTAADFTVSIDWGDGTTSAGTVVANSDGSFDVVASHTWSAAGTFTFTVGVTANTGPSISARATASISPRLLSSSGSSFTIDKKTPFSGTVATFSDTLPGTLPGNYVVTITWSDGVTSAATIVQNPDGSFSIQTSRTFSAAGIVTATVSISTTDGLFSTTCGLTATVVNKSGKTPNPKK